MAFVNTCNEHYEKIWKNMYHLNAFDQVFIETKRTLPINTTLIYENSKHICKFLWCLWGGGYMLIF